MIEHALTVIIGVTAVCALFLFMMSRLTEQHLVLQLLVMIFVLSAIMLIPKAAMDAQTVCEAVVNTSTTSGSTTAYTYQDFCYDRPEGTAESFLQLTQRMYYLVLAYAFVFFAVTAIAWLYRSAKPPRRAP